jgi:DNA modification methylase
VTVTLLRGDALHLPLADHTVDLCVTSPPYFGLRSYQDGGQHYAGQIGSEATPAEWVEAMLAATAEMVRVLKPCGSIWVNLGDKYVGGIPGGHVGGNIQASKYSDHQGQFRRPTTGHGLPSKCLIGLPWRYALACIDQLGLILRAEVIWSKPNGLPESVTDRVRRSHEQWFHFTVQPRYFSAVDEIREPHAGEFLSSGARNARYKHTGGVLPGERINGDSTPHPDGMTRWGGKETSDRNPLGKLPGSVWTVPSQPLTVPPELGVDHFAAFPMAWPRRLIGGWSPAGICTVCGEGRRPVKGVDWSKVPHRMTWQRSTRPTNEQAARWASDFADWCDETGISRTDLDVAAGTSDMGGWWASRLPHRTQVPTPVLWGKLRQRWPQIPARFDALVGVMALLPVSLIDVGDDIGTTGRHNTTGGGLRSADYTTVTGYVCTCPDATAPTTPARILDPFGGTGTTALVAHVMGRHGISVDLSADYCRLAAWRTTDPAQLAQAAQVDKPPVQTVGQDALFEVTG